MRPNTLKEAVDRIACGEPQDVMLAEFLDTFYLADDPHERLAMLREEPPAADDARLNALVAAIAHYLAQQFILPGVPDWVFGPQRFLQRAWHTTSSDAPGMREYLTFSSPAEFRCRNIFTEAVPLRRARRPYRSGERASA